MSFLKHFAVFFLCVAVAVHYAPEPETLPWPLSEVVERTNDVARLVRNEVNARLGRAPVFVMDQLLVRDDDAIRKVCKDFVTEYKELDVASLEVSTLSGGITNQLYKVVGGGHNVLVRYLGDNTELLINRKQELENLEMLAGVDYIEPPIAVFGNGRIEPWIVGRNLGPEEMAEPAMSRKIAHQLGYFHTLDTDTTQGPVLWRTLESWIAVAKELDFSDQPEMADKLKELDISSIEKEIAYMRTKLEDVASPLVFAHNDLLNGNVMWDKDTDKVTLIDFEYAATNPRGYDIGDHFAEWAGFDGDWRRYPNREQQYNFYRPYLVSTGVAEADIDDTMLSGLYGEVNKYGLVSHLVWGVWAIVQARYSAIDFDYMEFCRTRMVEYHNKRDVFLAL